jgi:hypothetical protein
VDESVKDQHNYWYFRRWVAGCSKIRPHV